MFMWMRIPAVTLAKLRKGAASPHRPALSTDTPEEASVQAVTVKFILRGHLPGPCWRLNSESQNGVAWKGP